jgi:hypothetical protein
MNYKTLTPQTTREHKQDPARQPQAMNQDDGLGFSRRYGETSSMRLSARRAASASAGATLI